MQSTSLTERIRHYYDAQEWRYQYDEEKNMFRMYMKIDADELDSCEVRTTVRKDDYFTTLVNLPLNVPEKKRHLAASYISAVNYGLLLGCFELDFRDGEIRYKNTCFCGDTDFDERYIERHILVGLQMCELYGPGQIDVLFRGADPAETAKKLKDKDREDEESF